MLSWFLKMFGVSGTKEIRFVVTLRSDDGTLGDTIESDWIPHTTEIEERYNKLAGSLGNLNYLMVTVDGNHKYVLGDIIATIDVEVD